MKIEVPLNYLMTNKAEVLSRKESFEALIDFDVIFVGEIHDSRLAHKAELTLLTGLSKRDPDLVLALEMFERDVQHILDAYLQGKISEDKFLKQSRPWPNYQDDYRPLIELAKTKGIPVIAANVPRRAAAAVAMANRISPKVVGEDRFFLPKKVHLDSRKYHERFVASMAQMPIMLP